MKHFDDDSFLISKNFNEHTLAKGIIDFVSRLEDYRANPVSKAEIRYRITEILKGTQILEEWCNAIHDNVLEDDVIEALDQKDIERNLEFLTEYHKDSLVAFYKGQKAAGDAVRNDCYRY